MIKKNVLISRLDGFVGQTIVVSGWVNNTRSSGKIIFIEIRDGSGYVQAIIDQGTVNEKVWSLANNLNQETSCQLTGAVTKHPKKDEYELQVSEIELIGLTIDYPIGNKEHGPDFLLEKRHLWLRSRKQWALLRIRHAVYWAMCEFLNKHEFIKFDSPILTPNACEGTTELFEIDYFGERKAYLSQSGQLYLEAGISAHGRVYDFGPVFRAEKSKTRRHLTEFWMMDAEMAFIELEDNLIMQEELISYVAEKVLERCDKELDILERDKAKLQMIKPPFIRLTHKQAVDKLRALGSDINYNDDLGGDDETLLTSDTNKPVFVTHWPAHTKAFYMKRAGDLALCADLIATEGFGEIIGGSQREDSLEELEKRIKEHNLPLDYFQWYLDTRRFGSVPHSGFGVGLERLVAWMSGVRHIRETIPFPRMINRLEP
jgi:asparaginyl-tRNA synthetase